MAELSKFTERKLFRRRNPKEFAAGDIRPIFLTRRCKVLCVALQGIECGTMFMDSSVAIIVAFIFESFSYI